MSAESAAARRLGIEKFKHSTCPKCGSAQSIISGAWLRLQREKAGLSVREAARRIGFSAAYLSDVEHSRRNCTPKICAFYESL